jgi:hypothetical protein
VADSLRARGYTSERFGLSLWEAYYRAIEETVDSSFALVTTTRASWPTPERS